MSVRRVARVALLLFAGGVVAAQEQRPTFSSRLEVVRLDVLVTDNGQPVRGLQAADFEVFDNGVRQDVDLVSFEQIPLNVVLSLDVSSSVKGERLEHLRDAGRTVLAALKKDDHAALVTFTQALTQDGALTANVSQLAAALDRLEPSGDTALVDGAYAGLTLADVSAGRGLLIVFSDGVDTASWLQPDAVVDAGRRSDVVVYGVSAGARNRSFLNNLATATGGRLYEVESTRNLRAVFLAALEEFRQRYLVSYTPNGVTKGGWHKVDVRVKGRRVTVRARPGYIGSS